MIHNDKSVACSLFSIGVHLRKAANLNEKDEETVE